MRVSACATLNDVHIRCVWTRKVHGLLCVCVFVHFDSHRWWGNIIHENEYVYCVVVVVAHGQSWQCQRTRIADTQMRRWNAHQRAPPNSDYAFCPSAIWCDSVCVGAPYIEHRTMRHLSESKQIRDAMALFNIWRRRPTTIKIKIHFGVYSNKCIRRISVARHRHRRTSVRVIRVFFITRHRVSLPESGCCCRGSGSAVVGRASGAMYAGFFRASVFSVHSFRPVCVFSLCISCSLRFSGTDEGHAQTHIRCKFGYLDSVAHAI